MIAKSIAELVGRTPLLELCGYERAHGLGARLLAKLEYLNPTGSVKDRAALFILDEAERAGGLRPGGTVIEPTSGNTGIGLAALCAVRGYRLILTMPDTMSAERRKLLAAFGAELVLTPGREGMAGAIAEADRLHARIEGSVLAGQFVNPANPAAHYATTGPEIWQDAAGKVDFFVAGVGTGGTIGGAVRYLKEKNPALRAVAVEPKNSAVLSGGKAGRDSCPPSSTLPSSTRSSPSRTRKPLPPRARSPARTACSRASRRARRCTRRASSPPVRKTRASRSPSSCPTRGCAISRPTCSAHKL